MPLTTVAIAMVDHRTRRSELLQVSSLVSGACLRIFSTSAPRLVDNDEFEVNIRNDSSVSRLAERWLRFVDPNSVIVGLVSSTFPLSQNRAQIPIIGFTTSPHPERKS